MTTEPTKPLHVAIIGTAPASRMLAPFDDPTWEIWACSAGNVNMLPRVNIWFEIHSVRVMMAPEYRAMTAPFYAWLKQKSEDGSFNVVMQEVNSYVPKAIPYPRDRMIEKFGRNWFTSSVAYMMAQAIASGAKKIALFGVDMAADQEHYSAQRAGCTRFIEIAEERGIEVYVPPESCLKAAVPMYGYSEATPFGRRIDTTMQLVQQQLNNINAQQQSLRDQANFFAGAQEQLRYFQRTWTDGAELEVELGDFPKLQQAADAAAAAPVAEFTLNPMPMPSVLTSSATTVRMETWTPAPLVPDLTTVMVSTPPFSAVTLAPLPAT